MGLRSLQNRRYNSPKRTFRQEGNLCRRNVSPKRTFRREGNLCRRNISPKRTFRQEGNLCRRNVSSGEERGDPAVWNANDGIFVIHWKKNHALGRKKHTKWKDSLVICVFYCSLYWSFIFFRATVDVFTKEIEASKTSLSSERKDRWVQLKIIPPL